MRIRAIQRTQRGRKRQNGAKWLNKMPELPVPTESEEQQRLFQWMTFKSVQMPGLELAHHIPNEGKRSYNMGARLRAEGMKAGVPDIFIPVAKNGYHGMYVEMKRRKGGVVSPEQKYWLERLTLQGYKCVVCKGWEMAAEEISEYMTGKREI